VERFVKQKVKRAGNKRQLKTGVGSLYFVDNLVEKEENSCSGSKIVDFVEC
jgi:hypothetical protein